MKPPTAVVVIVTSSSNERLAALLLPPTRRLETTLRTYRIYTCASQQRALSFVDPLTGRPIIASHSFDTVSAAELWISQDAAQHGAGVH